MEWIYDDGGRKAAGFRGHTGDCVTRAVAIATGVPYREVYDELFDRQREFIARKRKPGRATATPRTGVFRKVYEPYLFSLGWIWLPTMSIGSGTTVHLRDGELPDVPIIARLSRHIVAVRDGQVRDTHDPGREGTRAVYGYYEPGAGARVVL